MADICVNHPDRAAVEHCEVCDKPLCAYCLYYTRDGQRLCLSHAREAEAHGATIYTPTEYADGLISSQIGANRTEPPRFEGNWPDVLALVGMLVGLISLTMCTIVGCPAIGPIGLILSLIALFRAKEARDPVRTRTMAGVGATLSALWVLVMAACFLSFSAQSAIFTSTLNGGNIAGFTGGVQVTVVVPAAPLRATAIPAATETPTPAPR